MQIQIFKHASGKDQIFEDVRTIEIDGELWFVASDIARNLGYTNPQKAIRDHCKDKGRTNRSIPTPSGLQSMTLINEPNVYRLIIKSQLPTATEKQKAKKPSSAVPVKRKLSKFDKNILKALKTPKKDSN